MMYKRREIEDMRESLDEIIQKGKRQQRLSSWKAKVLPWVAGGALVGALAFGGVYLANRLIQAQPPAEAYLTEAVQATPTAGLEGGVAPTPTISLAAPTYEPTIIPPTPTRIPPTPTSIPPTPTEEPYNFCSNLEVSIQGFRVREQLAELRDSIYSKIESEYGNKSTEYTLMDVLISAKEDMVKAEIVHNPFGGNPGVPEVYDLSYDPGEIRDFIALAGGPNHSALLLDAEAAAKASSFLAELLSQADYIEAHRGNKTLSLREISDLLEELPEMMGDYSPTYLTPLGERYAITIGDNYDIIVDGQTGRSILDRMGMDTNCGY